MNGACVGHCTVLMHSLLTFAMHLGQYQHRKRHFIKEYKRKKIPPLTPMLAIDVAGLLTDKEGNLKLKQIRGTHPGILDLLGNPGSPLYAEPLSMTEHFNTMIVGTCHLGDLPQCGHCKDSDMTACVYEDEVRQVCQKILGCLDMRVLDGNIIVPTCLHTPTLILPHKHFLQLYFDPDNQGRYASRFPSGGQGFLQPRGDIRASIVPKDFRALPANVHGAIDAYFHRQELEDWAEEEDNQDQEMSTDTEAAQTVNRLHVGDPVVSVSLQVAVCETLAPATAPQPEEQEYYYDSDDSVLDLDAEFPDIAERLVEWRTTRQATTPLLLWQSRDFGKVERASYERQPDLRQVLNQTRQARMAANIPVQQVMPLMLPHEEVPLFESVRDLDQQRQRRFDQTVAKCQPSPLEDKQHKRAKTPPQPDLEDTPSREHPPGG